MKVDATKVILVGVVIAGLGLSGCAKWKARRAERRAAREARQTAQQSPQSRPIILDGQFNDWSGSAATVVDGQSIYLRVAVEDKGPSERISLWMDVDNSAGTGATGMEPAAHMGIDLIIEDLGSGMPQAYAVGSDGSRAALTAEQIGLSAVPSSDGRAWEIRIHRRVDSGLALAPLLQAGGMGTDLFIMQDGTGRVVGWSDPESFEKPVSLAADY